MCGILGIITDEEQPLGPILIEAAPRLTYRGYDPDFPRNLSKTLTVD